MFKRFVILLCAGLTVRGSRLNQSKSSGNNKNTEGYRSVGEFIRERANDSGWFEYNSDDSDQCDVNPVYSSSRRTYSVRNESTRSRTNSYHERPSSQRYSSQYDSKTLQRSEMDAIAAQHLRIDELERRAQRNAANATRGLRTSNSVPKNEYNRVGIRKESNYQESIERDAQSDKVVKKTFADTSLEIVKDFAEKATNTGWKIAFFIAKKIQR